MEDSSEKEGWGAKFAKFFGLGETSPDDDKLRTQMFVNSGQGGDWRGVVPAIPKKEGNMAPEAEPPNSQVNEPVSETKKV